MENNTIEAPFETMTSDGWPAVHGGGDVFALDCAAAVMMHLGNSLLSGGRKIRVTIESDPDTGKFKFSREVIS